MISQTLRTLMKATPYALYNQRSLSRLQPSMCGLASQQSRHFAKFINNLDGADLSEDVPSKFKDLQDVYLPHPVYYTKDQLESQTSGHHVPVGFTEKAAWYIVSSVRVFFDFMTGYSWLRHTEKLLLRRVMYLETIAGIPGMVGAANRHLKSLRRIKHDNGWIHTLLEEAENERMHLMTALLLLKPGKLMKISVIIGQAGFTAFYTLAYAMSPLFCHRFVGYLEEEAFKTYTKIVKHIDQGLLPGFSNAKAPIGAIKYWDMPEDSTLREIFLAIRADENHHRLVNHTFAAMEANDVNPFPPGF